MRTTPSLSRRQIITASGALLLGGSAAIVGGIEATRRVGAHRPATPGMFSLGVAAGDPVADGFVMWTRLARDPLHGGGMDAQAVDVEWQVAADERFRRVVRTGTAVATAEDAHSVHVEVAGLVAATPHWYRFRVGRDTSTIGTVRTAPTNDQPTARLRFALASCQNYEQGFFSAHAHLAREEVDAVLFVGDYIYEGAPAKALRSGIVRLHGGAGEAVDLATYRDRYAQYRSDPSLQAAHAAAAWIVTPDDHEVSNNYAGLVGHGGAAVSTERFSARRAAAYRAWWEHMPVREAQRPTGPNATIHRRLAYGDLATVHVLDSRQHRSGPAATDEAAAAPERTMLGPEQEAWLAAGMRRSGTTWDLLANQVMVASRNVHNLDRDGRFDRWQGYPAARSRLLATLAEASNPVVLTGDLHATWASDLFAVAEDPTSPVVAAEIVGTSLSSGGDQDRGLFRAGFDAFRPANPQWKLFDSRRGYTLLDVTPGRIDVSCRSVDSVLVASSPISTTARLVIQAGHPGVAIA